MIQARNSVRKLKVLGYPFAGGQSKYGIEMTPKILQSKPWFQKLPIEYEEIPVSDKMPNSFRGRDSAVSENAFSSDEENTDQLEAKNVVNVMKSAAMLRS